MKNELKTLKELESNADFCEKCNDLKQKAIKLVKAPKDGWLTLTNRLPPTVEGSEEYHLSEDDAKPLRFCLKYLFNITEEDLK